MKTQKASTKTQKASTKKTHWPVHPIAEIFPKKTPEEWAEMKKDMVDRLARGLDPLESPILLWENRIVDGRSRDEIWVRLAEEKACNGFFARNRPPTEDFKPGKHGTLGAWMRAKSRNMVVRQTPADQRAAIFLKAVKAYPELKAVLDDIKEENLQRKKAGRPLGAGDQRGNTNERVAKMAQVGATTVKQVKKLEKEAPEKFEEVAQGKTSAKKALKEVQRKKQTQAGEKDGKARAKVNYHYELWDDEHEAKYTNRANLIKKIKELLGGVALKPGGEKTYSIVVVAVDEAKEEEKADQSVLRQCAEQAAEAEQEAKDSDD
jgi:hypothetical protein